MGKQRQRVILFFFNEDIYKIAYKNLQKNKKILTPWPLAEAKATETPTINNFFKFSITKICKQMKNKSRALNLVLSKINTHIYFPKVSFLRKPFILYKLYKIMKNG